MSESKDRKLLNGGVVPAPAFSHVTDDALTRMEIEAATEGTTVPRQFGSLPPRVATPPPPRIDPRDITQFIPKD